MTVDFRALALSALALIGCEQRTPADGPHDAVVSASTSSASVGGGVGAGGGETGDFDPCKRCGASAVLGTIAVPDLNEISGIAASALHSDVLYVHNDSGDAARFFAIDLAGKELARFEVDGAFAVDWEDAASGPCPEGRCVYFGDIGDNLAQRGTYTVYRVPEPKSLTPASQHLPSEAFHFTYPDGNHDAETLLVHPLTGEVAIVTKVVVGASSVYRFPMPLVPGKTAVLEKIGEVDPPGGIARFTGGSIHPAGKSILLRAYTALYAYPMTGGIGEALALEPCSVPVAVEKQGEAVEWLRSGDGYVTISEGSAPPVNRVGCP